MQGASPQQVIDRLAKRRLQAGHSPAQCRLASEPRRRRGTCSACTVAQEFEIDREITQLIDRGAIRGAGLCPYRVVASHLVAGLTLGPEVFRARSAGRLCVDPKVEIKGARRRIRSILYATRLSHDDIETISISNDDDWWQALYAVVAADRALEKALALFQARIAAKTSRSLGRIGVLHNQAVARAMALAWRQLTGRLPAKDNSKFQHLLQAAIVTIFGERVKVPNLLTATKTAVDRIRKDAVGRG
jgi:hypothetical protein